jgi:superfamily II DNA or RNA helicase/very-short-patch-repair endonuclease
MGRNIDDLVDDRARGIQSTGEEYHDEFLLTRPKTEWSPYIDETALDVRSGIQIGDLTLSKNNFGQELGSYYRRGLEKTAGRYADLPSVLKEKVSDEKLGLLAYQLNEFSYDIARTELGVDDVEKATEAVIEKILTRHVGSDLSISFDLSGATVSDITAQLFNNEAIASNVDLLLDEFEDSASQGLLSLLDEPQMMTPLWSHQRDALQNWWENDQRGYVDMATATGKTVLGLGAIALKYGELHPDDQFIGGLGDAMNSSDSDDVLIVAHSDLILEQWRREFEKHLNIPQERTTGSEDITLKWGTIHFRTPQSLINEDRVEYDLVLLDEAHHYATGSDWGSLLDEFTGDVLAMSGSVDDAGSDSDRIKERLSNSIGPELKRYTITDARADGVIPSFDWEVHYAPYDVVGDDLEKTAQRAERPFREFQKRLAHGDLSLETDRRLKTYEDVRRFSHTKEGNSLKQQDDAFRELATRLFSRRTKQWNLSPVLDAVINLVVEHHTTEKVVVLADSNAQVEELESRLADVVANPSSIYLASGSQSRQEQRETIEEFDKPETAGILLGTGDLLGEGVDMKHASVAINMATGGVNQELVQRIGRVLRNPVDTPKHAMFYNVVGVSPTEAAAIPREDGKQLIEQAAGFCSLGRRFDKLPGFATAASLDQSLMGTLLAEGAEFIDSLDTDGEYEWETELIYQADLTALHDAVQATPRDVDTILGAWEEYAWEHSEDPNGEADTRDSGESEGTTSDGTTSDSKTLEEYFQEVAAPDQAKEQSLEAAAVGFEQIEQLLNVHEAGGLSVPPDQSGVDILTDKIQGRLEKTQSAIAEIIQDHNGTSVAEPSLKSIVELGRRTRSQLDETIELQNGNLKLILGKDDLEGDAPSRTETTKGDSESEAETISTPDHVAPTESELLEEIRRLNSALGGVPTKTELANQGNYSVSQFEDVFGSWSDAVREAGYDPQGSATRRYSRDEVLTGLQEVAATLNKPPSVNDINEHAPFSATVVYNFFDSIGDARRAAGVAQLDQTENTSVEAGEDQHLAPNALAEHYELFRRFASLLNRLIESDQTAYTGDGDHPMNRWHSEIHNVVFGAGLTDDAPSYGQQQGSRNPHTMSEYRTAFGDGETVTEYQVIETTRLTDDDAAVLIDQQVINAGEDISLPVAPQSGVPLPLVVSSDDELADAIALLSEFPAEPDPGSAAESAIGEQSGAQSTSLGDGDESSSTMTPPVDTSETPEEQDSSGDDQDPGTEPDASTGEQVFFWDRDAETVTEFDDDDALTDAATAHGDSLDLKIDEWKSQLLDLTRRNKLISFKPTKSKSLPFEETDPTVIAAELDNGDELFLRKHPTDETNSDTETLSDLSSNELLPTRTPDEAANSLSQIGLKNKQYLRERGVDSLYLSLGMLRWYSADYSDEANRSPLFLAPIELEEQTVQDGAKHDYVLKPKADGLRLNPALRKKLAAERDLSLPADTALSLATIDSAFETVYETLRGFDRWTIQPDVVLGIFDFTKFSLYTDLERNRDAVKNNPIIQALNGEMGPIQAAEGDITTPAASELDDVVDPMDTYQVLDADSSQQEAIEAAKRGKSFVLQGPPGTGKSQTIANIIAEKLAAGERILFVSEKQAALDVVKTRLDAVGLGRFCLEVHGEKATNNDVLGSLEPELKAPQIKPAADRPKQLRKLRDRRDKINQYGRNLFFSPTGWDLTAYQAFGIVSEHADAPRIEIGITDPVSVGQETLEHAVDELETLARFTDALDTYDTGPWRHTTLRQWGVDTGDSMRTSLDQQLSAIDTLEVAADEVESVLGTRPASLAEFRELRDLLRHVSARPDITWQNAFFDGSFGQEGGRLDELADLEQQREALLADLSEHYQRSFFSADGSEFNTKLAGYGMLKVLKPSYRSLKRQITIHAKDDYNPSHDQLLEDTQKLAELQRIEAQREDFRGIINRLGPLYEGSDTDWDTLTHAQDWVADLTDFDVTYTDPIKTGLLDGTLPDTDPLLTRMDEALADYEDAAAFFTHAMDLDQIRVNGTSFHHAPFPDLVETLQTLRSNVPALQRRVQFASQLDTVRDTICADYIDRFLTGDYSPDHLVAAFEKRFYTKWLNTIYEQTDLGSFNADEMERYLEEFRRLDQEQQELAKVEVQHEVTKHRPSLSLEHASSSEQVLVRRETEKQRRHKPLRELFDEAGSFITQLTPCFMMSPLSVAQYLKADSIHFDTVVFDEASQIMPQDAVSSLIRADQAIIAGDTKQLPPTSFFQSDVETTEDVREDLDSILEETAAVLPEKNLRWHYRSRTEELIQFSNHHYYNNSLRTFPENDPDVETGVEFEYVEDGVYDRGGSRQNEIEAQRVIDLIEDHAETRSDKSLGVVAFSSAQEQAIRGALAERRADNPVLDAFVSQDDVLDEFFIKNLEMVQGDERDRMIFTVGYGPAQDGTVSTNFGPLNKTGGERRLNVAVTRAKEQVTVVCSMLPGDIDLSGSNSTGAKHFKNYLEYAQKGEQALARNDHVTDTLDFDSHFEEAVYDALKQEGHDVVTQVQSSSYSIDLAIKHPEQPGKFILGIECDGAAYHSSKTARDRDRTRQAVLENLGWTIHRIWSPDWASNREAQIQAINNKIDSLVDGNPADTSTTSVPTHEPDAVPSKSKLDHEAITEFVEPSLEWTDRYSVNKHGQNTANRNAIQDTVKQNGPLKYDTAMRTYLNVWSQSRAGKRVQRAFKSGVQTLTNQDQIYQRDDFLWPARHDLDFKVRVNTESATRSIDEIPKEEIAKAIAVLLDEGGRMTRDDVVLETTRLIGYQRRGKRIEKRVGDAIDILDEAGALEVDTDEKINLRPDVQVDTALLNRIY